MYNVAMPRKAAEQITHTLYECIVLRMYQHLRHEILTGVLYESFTCKWSSENGLANVRLKLLLSHQIQLKFTYKVVHL